MVRRSVILAAALICGSALNAQNVTRVETVAGVTDIDRATQAQDVRFRTSANDRMTVAVRLGGSGPYQFLVDTGADRSAVSSAIAARRALAPASPAELHSSTGVTTVSTAKVPSLEFTRPAQKLIEAGVLDSAYTGAEGNVGVDVLRSRRVQFDFDK